MLLFLKSPLVDLGPFVLLAFPSDNLDTMLIVVFVTDVIFILFRVDVIILYIVIFVTSLVSFNDTLALMPVLRGQIRLGSHALQDQLILVMLE